jgi:hypothetical protein
MLQTPRCYSPGSTGAGSNGEESSSGSDVGGSDVGGSGVGGSGVGGSVVGGSEVGGSEVGGSDVAGSEPLSSADEPLDPPLVSDDVFVAVAGGGEVDVTVACLIRVGVVVDRKVGMRPGVSTELLLSTVPDALSDVAKIAAVAGAPAGNVSSGITVVGVAVAAGVDSLRRELLMTKNKPAAMRTRSSNPTAPIRNQVALPTPDLAAGAAMVRDGAVPGGFPTAVVPAATAEAGGGTAAAGAPLPGTCMSTTVILSLPPA